MVCKEDPWRFNRIRFKSAPRGFSGLAGGGDVCNRGVGQILVVQAVPGKGREAVDCNQEHAFCVLSLKFERFLSMQQNYE